MHISGNKNPYQFNIVESFFTLPNFLNLFTQETILKWRQNARCVIVVIEKYASAATTRLRLTTSLWRLNHAKQKLYEMSSRSSLSPSSSEQLLHQVVQIKLASTLPHPVYDNFCSEFIAPLIGITVSLQKSAFSLIFFQSSKSAYNKDNKYLMVTQK